MALATLAQLLRLPRATFQELMPTESLATSRVVTLAMTLAMAGATRVSLEQTHKWQRVLMFIYCTQSALHIVHKVQQSPVFCQCLTMTAARANACLARHSFCFIAAPRTARHASVVMPCTACAYAASCTALHQVTCTWHVCVYVCAGTLLDNCTAVCE